MVNEYVFECGKELVVIKIDDNRKLHIKNNITNFQYIELTEQLFNDKEKRNQFKIMCSKIKNMLEDELDVYIVLEMAKLGYKLKSKL